MSALRDQQRTQADVHWVRLFHVVLDGRNFDHLTSLRCEGECGSGLGTARSA
jgi:hypothetical protein